LFIDRTKLKADTLRLFRYLSVDIDPYAVVRTLSVAQCQMVGIAKPLSVETEVLIMDEPTSSLMEPEAQALFKVIHELKRSGVGIVYISHRLDEMAETADRVTVFRDGHYTPNKTSINKPLKMCSTDLRSASTIPINV
jgi:ribose transport system ATP-binding protein